MINWPYFPYAFAVVLAIPFAILLRQYVFAMIKLKNQEIRLLVGRKNREAKLQAYERMVIFLERIKPPSLVKKFGTGLAASEVAFLLDKTICEEFEYNVSQQLYLSKNCWQKIVDVKEIVLRLIHSAYGAIGEGASAEDFKAIFLRAYMEGEDYIAHTIDELRKDMMIMT